MSSTSFVAAFKFMSIETEFRLTYIKFQENLSFNKMWNPHQTYFCFAPIRKWIKFVCSSTGAANIPRIVGLQWHVWTESVAKTFKFKYGGLFAIHQPMQLIKQVSTDNENVKQRTVGNPWKRKNMQNCFRFFPQFCSTWQPPLSSHEANQTN